MSRLCHLLLASALIAASALANQAGGLHVERQQDGELIVAQITARQLVDPALRERMQSGLTNRLVIDAKLAPEGLGAPVLSARRTVEIVFDLWDEHYLVQLDGAGPTQVIRLKTLAEVEKLLTQPIRVELGTSATCEPKRRYRVDATLTVNPVSQKVIERSREMVSAAPDERGGAGSRSLFGSVARVFFNVSTDSGVRELRGLSPYEVVKAPVRQP